MPNEILQKQGTSQVWSTAGGGDLLLTLTSLANNNGRKGAGKDWGATFPTRLRFLLETVVGTAPTAGNVIEVWWASSHDNTAFDGALAAGDAAMNDTDVLNQLHFVGALHCDNVATAQKQSWVFFLPSRYGFPVIFNRSGQALSATAGDHKLTATPLIDEIQ